MAKKKKCNDCGGYDPKGRVWGNCMSQSTGDGLLVVRRSDKACGLFYYYGVQNEREKVLHPQI
jgi:hypothetical protein